MCPWLLRRRYGWNTRGLPALRLPAVQPREHVGALLKALGSGGHRTHSWGESGGNRVGGGCCRASASPPTPGSPAPVKAWELEGTAAQPVSLATPASTVSSKFALGGMRERGLGETPR